MCGDAGLPWRTEADLTARIRETVAMSEAERERLRARAVQRVQERYNWDAVTAQYEALFESLRK